MPDKAGALPINIRLGWKGLPGAYYKNWEIPTVKSFIVLGPVVVGESVLILYNFLGFLSMAAGGEMKEDSEKVPIKYIFV